MIYTIINDLENEFISGRDANRKAYDYPLIEKYEAMLAQDKK